MGGEKVAKKQTEKRTLTAEQAQALDLVLAGKTPAEVAGDLSVPEAEVIGWQMGDPVFVAELNRRRLAAWEADSQRLRSLAAVALDKVEELVTSGDDKALALKAATTILKIHQTQGKPKGETSPEAVEQDWARAEVLRTGFVF